MEKRNRDLTGRQFGRWTVIAEAPSKHTSYGRTLAMWTCQCKCGTIKDIAANDLKAGKSTQCKSCAGKKREGKNPDIIKSA